MVAREDLQVEFRSVGYSVNGRAIIENVDLVIARGETIVLLGESGCGKTTTLRLINSLIKPTRGSVIVKRKATTEWDPIELRRTIGYVLQDGGLFPHMTVAENIQLGLILSGSSKSSAMLRVIEVLNLVSLAAEDFAGRYPHELSGGQRQRVGVARALAIDPEMLLLDEPFGALDAITRTRLQREFARLVRELGKTAVFVTHDLHEAMLLADRIALMDKGRLVFLDSPEAFRRSELSLARAYLDTVLLPA